MKRIVVIFLVVVSIGLSSSPLHAHHSFSATFKSDEKISIEGVVTKFSFRNPHVLVYTDVTNEDGSVTQWVSEGAAATLYRRVGWSNGELKPGDRIKVTGDATHDGTPMTSIDSVAILAADGSVASQLPQMSGLRGEKAPPTPKAAAMPLTLSDGRPNLTGAWTNHGMANGRPRAPKITYTAAGQAIQDAFVLANDPQVFCDPPGIARQVGNTPHPARLIQEDDRVTFEYEEYGGYREVYFDDRAHLGIPTLLGDSTARYEGDTLVVETKNLLPAQTYVRGGIHSDQTTTKEVYKRVDSDTYGPVLNLDMYIADPVNFTNVVLMSREKMSAGEYSFIENDCHPPLRERTVVNSALSFFLTSTGDGNGANLGGLESADAHCASLAATVGQGDKDWVAYFSTTGDNGVSARERIGNGPWYNAKGVPIARNVDELLGEEGSVVWLTKETAVDERGSKLAQLPSTIQDDGAGFLFCFATGE